MDPIEIYTPPEGLPGQRTLVWPSRESTSVLINGVLDAVVRAIHARSDLPTIELKDVYDEVGRELYRVMDASEPTHRMGLLLGIVGMSVTNESQVLLPHVHGAHRSADVVFDVARQALSETIYGSVVRLRERAAKESEAS